ncbi:triple gene block protein 2 [Stevia carlavirus 1]|uniref:Movement protein TGB2 n=1 Tax=Stevia carlavirus 1 TaxID=2794421 RepID=A0AAE9P468_9VIRU|nr:triple gene block protein 2 [Stevia carlavirus 1]
MALTPPPDYTRSVLCCAIGLSLVLLVLVYTRNTLPPVGDNLHSLPHGGSYRDGTKTILYNSPSKLNSLEKGYGLANQPWAYVILITVAIVVSEVFYRRRICSCGRAHA